MSNTSARLVSLSKLHPAPWNPRSIKDARFQNLVKSITADPEFLWLRPVLAMADGTIYAGNMRYRAAQHAGMKTIPAIVMDVPEQLAKERALRDNGQWGEWEDDALLTLLMELSAAGSDMGVLGFADRQLVAFLARGAAQAGQGDPDAIPEPPTVPMSRAGDVWLLGAHRVMCGDSTDGANVISLAAGQNAECMWTDPPYGVSYVGKTKDALTIQNDGSETLPTLLANAFAMASDALVPGAPFYIARPAGALGLVFLNAIAAAGWQIHEELQWVKDSMVLGHSDYHLRHEDRRLRMDQWPGA